MSRSPVPRLPMPTPPPAVEDLLDLVVRPAEMRAVGRTLSNGAVEVRRCLLRLRRVTATVALHGADPDLGPDFAGRRDGLWSGLDRSAAALTADAEKLSAAATDALTADGDRWRPPVCRLPDDVRSDLDRRLTSAVAAGLSAAATKAIELADFVTSPLSHTTAGDPGGTYTTRRVAFAVPVPAHLRSDQPRAAGRLIAGAIDATADPAMLAHDEFGLLDHGGDRYTVVLPGVIDLSRPERGWNPDHRSVRDLDMAAVPSSHSTGIDGNPYARSVAEALATTGVPAGAELLIVGHSFGADTALDLAADAAFTSRYRVSHVVATGYFSQPQLSSVAPKTRVLVVQNRHDVVIRVGSAMPGVETGVLGCEPTGPIDEHGVSVVRFDGGLDWFGHSTDVYRSVFTGDADLESTDGEAVDEFMTSIDGGDSMATPATMVAIDISLPKS